MKKALQRLPIKDFSGLDTVSESSDAGKNSLRRAENLLLRPLGGLKRLPTFDRLWAMENLSTYEGDLGLTNTDKTCLIRIMNEGQVFLCFWDVPSKKSLGLCFAADDGSFSDDISLTASGASLSVLRKNLAIGKRWYFSRFFDEIIMGNGVDDNLIYQHSRVGMRLRLAGTNAAPDAPVISTLTTTSSQLNSRYWWTVTPGGATMYVFVNDTRFPGTSSNTITFSVNAVNGTGPPSITRTIPGSGSNDVDFVMELFIDGIQTSPNDMLNAINSSPLCEGYISADITTSDSSAQTSAPFFITRSGTDKSSNGFYNCRVRVAASYFDEGESELGLESSLSPASNTLKIFDFSRRIQVSVTGNTIGDMARFGFIRIYMELMTGGQKKWFLVKTVANATDTHTIDYTVDIGNNYEYGNNKQFWVELVPVANTYEDDHNFEKRLSGQTDYAEKSLRIPPCTMFEMVGDRLWASGNAATPQRIWIGRFERKGERVPEGCDTEFYLDILGKNNEPDRPTITNLRASEYRAHVHTGRGITLIDGVTLKKRIARAEIGAINPASSVLWENSEIPYLGSDGVFYEFANQQLYKSNITSKKSLGIVRDYADVNELGKNPGRANMAADYVNRMIWFWVPGKDGALVGFTMDFATGGIVGPLDFPKLLSTTRISSADGRIVGCDEGGNLFVVNLGQQNSENYPASDPFTYIDPDDPIPTNEAGYGNVVLPAGRLLRASTLVFETQYLDFGSPETRKGFYELNWSTVRNSRAILSITIESDDGRSVTREYGDVYGRERHKVGFLISGNAVRIRVTAVVAEDKPFAMRDMTLGFEIQGVR